MSSDPALGRYVRGTLPNGQFSHLNLPISGTLHRLYVSQIQNLALSLNKILS